MNAVVGKRFVFVDECAAVNNVYTVTHRNTELTLVKNHKNVFLRSVVHTQLHCGNQSQPQKTGRGHFFRRHSGREETQTPAKHLKTSFTRVQTNTGPETVWSGTA